MAKHKNITEHSGGYQVRIVRGGEEHSRFFSHNQWGGKRRALNGAINWRDQQLVVLGKPHHYIDKLAPTRRNKTTGVRGVTRTVVYDKRRDAHSVEYQVHYRIDGHPHTKKFWVGDVDNVTAEQEFHALRTAIKCRQDYVSDDVNGKRFNPGKYGNWKQRRIYE